METEKKRAVLRFAVVEFLFFAVVASSTYQTPFLKEIGFSSVQIGWITAIGSIIGMVLLPVWGIISDKMNSSRTPLLISVALTAIMYTLFAVFWLIAPGFLGVFYILVPLAMTFKRPETALLDGWVISELAPYGVGYGTVRMWGSIGYAVVTMGMSALLSAGVMSTWATFFIMPVLLIPFVFFTVKGKEQRKDEVKVPESEKLKKKVPLKVLFKNKRYVVYLIYTVGLCMYMSITVIYMAYILEYAGCDQSLQGTVVGFRALMEIIAMGAAIKLRNKVKLWQILVVSGVFFGTEHLLYGQAHSLPFLLFLMVLSGFAGGIMYSIGPSYVYESVDERVRNTAQSFVSVVMAVVGILGSLLGGYIIDSFGIQTVTFGCGIITISLTAFFVAANMLLQKKEKALTTGREA